MATTGILQISPTAYPGSGAMLDLSNYMRVNQGDGLNPADPEFTSKVWATSMLKEGGVLARESFQLKELQFPMYFSSTTRDGVSALLQQVNAMINAPGQTVGWQDQGASNMTYFDLASGQIDISYDFRQAGNYIIAGLLRLFCQPLGHTATMRLVASAAGTGPLLVMPIPSPILGDAPALIQAAVGRGTTPLARSVAVSALPYEYVPGWAVPSMIAGSGTVAGGSGAVASQYLRYTSNSGIGIGQVAAPNANAYAGSNRILMVARSSTPSAVVQYEAGIAGASAAEAGAQTLTRGPTAVGLATDWQLVDLGTVQVPSSVASLALSFFVGFGGAFPSNAATLTFDVTELIVLPDGQTTYLQESLYPGGAVATGQLDLFDGLNSESWLATGPWPTAPGIGFRWTPYQRGSIPKLPPSMSQPSMQLAVLSMGATAAAGALAAGPRPANEPISGAVWVRERYRFEIG